MALFSWSLPPQSGKTLENRHTCLAKEAWGQASQAQPAWGTKEFGTGPAQLPPLVDLGPGAPLNYVPVPSRVVQTYPEQVTF